MSGIKDNGDYSRIVNFFKTKAAKNHGISNIYLVKKIDEKGDESVYYGLNCLTNYGMEKMFSSSYNSPYYIYLGTGTGKVSPNDETLFEILYEDLGRLSCSSSTADDINSYSYPLYYDRDTGMITCIGKLLTYDNIPSYSGEKKTYKITEYGFGNDGYYISPGNPYGYKNRLWSHSLVYDENGKQTYFKYTNDEYLKITVFLCVSYHESLITNSWKNNVFPVITSASIAGKFNFGRTGGYINRLYGRRWSDSNDKIWDYAVNANYPMAYSALMNSEITVSHTFASAPLYPDSTSYSSIVELYHYIDYDTYDSSLSKYVQLDSPFAIEILPRLKEPKTFEVIRNVETSSGSYPTTVQSMHECTSMMLQVSRAKVDDVCMFNTRTGEWDNHVEFINDPDQEYYDSMKIQVGYMIAPTIYYTSAPDYFSKLYVYQNLNVDNPIVALTEDSSSTIYATDKYWDTSSWQLITNRTHIPEELRRSRYWITDTDSRSPIPVQPIREKDIDMDGVLRFPTKPEYFRKLEYTFESGFKRGDCDNYEYGWFIRDRIVYVPDQNISFPVTSDTSSSSYFRSMTWGKWLITFPEKKPEIIIINMDGVKETGIIPTPQVISLNDYGITSSSINSIETETGTGIFCKAVLQYSANVNNRFFVIDVRGDEPEIHAVIGSGWASAMYGTSNIAYGNTSKDIVSPNTELVIYNVDTKSVIKRIDTSEYFTRKDFSLVAHGKYVWAFSYNDYSYTWLIDTETEEWKPVNISFMKPYYYYSDPYVVSSIDGWMCLSHKYSGDYVCSESAVVVINVADPTNPIYPYSQPELYSSSYNGYSLCNASFKYIEENTLVLIISYKTSSYSYSRTSIIDIGRYYHTGELSCSTYISSSSEHELLPYGEYIINSGGVQVPIKLLLDYKITGSTDTVSSLIIGSDTYLSNTGTIKFTVSNVGPFKTTISGERQ